MKVSIHPMDYQEVYRGALYGEFEGVPVVRLWIVPPSNDPFGLTEFTFPSIELKVLETRSVKSLFYYSGDVPKLEFVEGGSIRVFMPEETALIVDSRIPVWKSPYPLRRVFLRPSVYFGLNPVRHIKLLENSKVGVPSWSQLINQEGLK